MATRAHADALEPDRAYLVRATPALVTRDFATLSADLGMLLNQLSHGTR
jgi:hypothetical protein